MYMSWICFLETIPHMQHFSTCSFLKEEQSLGQGRCSFLRNVAKVNKNISFRLVTGEGGGDCQANAIWMERIFYLLEFNA